MVIVWRESDHEEIYNLVVNDPRVVDALYDCVLSNFFRLFGMQVLTLNTCWLLETKT